jgi:hypothetical protein
VTFGEYLVTGQRRYRGHEPGTTFEAQLDRNAEARAIRRGDIRLLRLVEPDIPPGAAVLPDGWTAEHTNEAPEGASVVGGG